MTAKETLAAAQALYERHKLFDLSAPDSRHLTASLAGTLAERINAVTSAEEYTPSLPLTDPRPRVMLLLQRR